jgi:hypothetical protein
VARLFLYCFPIDGGIGRMKSTTKAVSRRQMLAAAAVGAVAVGAAAAPMLSLSWLRRDDRRFNSWWSRQSLALERSGIEEWTRQVGTGFLLVAEAGPLPAKLVSVKAFPSSGRRPRDVTRNRAFAAVFDVDGTLPAGNRIYSLRHPQFGAMDVFFSAPGGIGTATRIEAVFN